MFPYLEERFTADEEAILRRYVTNLHLPVFALVNLPEVVKGALFARYSRSPKSLRRLFLDEFVGDLDMSGDASVDATVGLERAEQLYERVFVEYGDDSVAQLGGVHLACEQSSNVLSKVLEWGRLMSYLEQSTRYIAYDIRLDSGHYRYFRPPEILDSPYGARYVGDMDRVFDTYAALLPPMQDAVIERFPRQAGDSDFVYRQATKAKSLDALRGLLPAASLSNIGLYGTGQSYEQLLLRMRAHPLPEARTYADMMLIELRKVIPSFLQRVDVAERGGQWTAYLASTRDATARLVARLWPEDAPDAPDAPDGPDAPDAPDSPADGDGDGTAPEVTLLDFDPEGEDKVLAAICFSQMRCSERQALQRVRRLGHDERVALLAAYVGERRNRRHRPGRAFERTDYRFELVTDYGAFRDLQRHRMLTIEWQRLGITLGYDMPELVADAGLGQGYADAIERAEDLYRTLAPHFPEQAAYAVALAHRIRYVMQCNAREAMHLIELRSGPQGHPAYRRVAQQMHRAIAEEAGHRALAGAMAFVDHGNTELERLESERRAERRRSEKSATH
jgi:thymidylate synthase ThyX